MTPDQLNAIRQRVEAATPGPWWVEPERDTSIAYIAYGTQGDPSETYDLIDYYHVETDYAFLAAARFDIPALLAEVERLTARAAELEREMKHLRHRVWKAEESELRVRQAVVAMANAGYRGK